MPDKKDRQGYLVSDDELSENSLRSRCGCLESKNFSQTRARLTRRALTIGVAAFSISPISSVKAQMTAGLDDRMLISKLKSDLYDGRKKQVEMGVNILLERGWTPYEILTEALVEGMRIVGK